MSLRPREVAVSAPPSRSHAVLSLGFQTTTDGSADAIDLRSDFDPTDRTFYGDAKSVVKGAGRGAVKGAGDARDVNRIERTRAGA